VLVESAASDSLIATPISSKVVVIVDRQEFIRGCLESWIKTSCREFNTSNVADVTIPAMEAVLPRAIMFVFYANGIVLANSWLDEQIAWLRDNQPDTPIVAIIEPDKTWPIGDLANRLRLQGYIPTSSSMEVASAVLRLVAVGGTYIPHIQNEEPSSVLVGQIHHMSKAAHVAGLTPRECGVLELLERGMSNKIIAYKLNLSQSTVKAHVHNIILKLKVHNRTEAAVASHHPQSILIA